ncbi:hypothetical protein CEUSTIGMA_g12773.t1 [Chlamydomonas eustigma]|uniref:Uncharacterized protein n=1 Tax=Chlamydomonas eustigma TaxID=1157962 RepID=A0A250XQM8_9CHLO|nr:hypothetical protein CEUSTIGMA_g12773.t1 [Chlamydomonas eustigma]|eukprot:GAX85356.1 hypothetical protein CEUSTIGMA_g12773.t1 [Chlamydomonas eustigma]
MSTLRVTAPPYVPLSSRCSELPSQSSVPIILNVPLEVISIVFSKLESCDDSLSCGLVCKSLLSEMASAPLSLNLSAKASHLSSPEMSTYISNLARSLEKYFPGLAHLDLSGTSVEDSDVLNVTLNMKKLKVLNLSGCKKLSSKLCEALITVVKLPCLQTLNLQRCFQLNKASLQTILSQCASNPFSLNCVFFSHLDFSSKATDIKPGLSLPSVNCSNINVLALHNCTLLSQTELVSLTKACPRLSYLFLGGSSFSLKQQLGPDQKTMVAWTDIEAASTDDSICIGIPWSRVKNVVDTCPALMLSKLSMSAKEHISDIATLLAGTALLLPQLKALELSFLPLPTVAAVTHTLWSFKEGQGGHTSCPEVWDLTQEAGVLSALKAMNLSSQGVDCHITQASHTACPPLVMALKCAANCSSSARATPLHNAAFSASCEVVSGLIRLGAGLDARDVGGATALFLAAEAGRITAVHVLLDAGADATMANATGESPLYIACLKGHLEVVRALLGGLAKQGVQWHKLRYCDGWTPLMAAVVANHCDVVSLLLSDVDSAVAVELMCAANRYGQSVLHIAARKGSQVLLRLLLDAGGFSALRIADCAGDTPMDVAVKHSHRAAVNEFLRISAYS